MSAQAYPAYLAALKSLDDAWTALSSLAQADEWLREPAEMCAAGVELARQHLYSVDYLLPSSC